MSSQPKTQASPVLTDQNLRTMAVDIYNKLRNDGCEPREIVSLSTELLSLVTEGIVKKTYKN